MPANPPCFNQRRPPIGPTGPFASNRPAFRLVPCGDANDFVPICIVTRMPFALMVRGANSLAVSNCARILALAHPRRIALTPHAPKLTELGMPLATGLWLARHAPRATPSTSEELAAFAAGERAQWAQLVNEKKIRVA